VPEAGPRKSFESIHIAKCVQMELALMRAKPRCGHRMAFSKKQECQAANCFFEATASGNLASQQFHTPQQTSFATCACDHRSRGSIARIRARRTWLGCVGP
jgi:hypothetical protein